MPTDVEAAAETPLSVDQAIAALLPQDEQPAAEAAPESAPEPDEEFAVEAPDSDPGEAEEAVAEEEQAEPEPETEVEAPAWWSADKKAKFKALPPELQTIVAEEEANRERAYGQKKQAADEARKQAEATLAQMGDLTSRLDQAIGQAEVVFASKWPKDIDWVATAQQYGVEQAQMMRLEWERDTQALGRLAAERKDAEARAFETFLKAEAAKLPEIAPELADPKEGPDRLKALGQYLVGEGVPAERLRGVDAVSLRIAHKAMKWDRHVADQAKAKAALKAPKPQPVPAKPAVKPAAAQPGTSTQRTAQQITNRFAQTKSVDDAVALLLAKKAS